VVPDIHFAVLFLGMPGAQARTLGYLVTIGNFFTLALPAEAPAVEGAPKGFTHDPAAHGEVGPQVRAIGVM
jgi:hypothetical protein